MKAETTLRRHLARLEKIMEAQAAECQEKGYGTAASLFWDKRCVQRATIRWVLGMRPKPFNKADTLAGW